VPTLPNARALTISSFDSALDERAVSCDLAALTFVDAYGLLGTACALRAALLDSPDVVVRAPASAQARAHLTAMGFRDFLSGIGRSSSLPAGSALEASGVVVPLRGAVDSGGSQQLSALLWAQLREHVDPSVLQAIAEGVWEIVGNALEHSGSDALILGQVYRTSRGGRPPDHDDRVQVVVGDVGRGIRASFLATGAQAPRDDLAAINLALEYLVSSVTDDPGRGQGLFTTMEQIVGLAGLMIVRSGAAKVTIDAAGRREQTVPPLPGVIVAMSLPLYPG
jgi:hypothetical protein